MITDKAQVTSRSKVKEGCHRGVRRRDARIVSRSSLPLQEGTSAFGEVRYHQGNRSHKGRHKGFTLFSSQEHHQGDPSSPLKVLFEVAQPSHKARANSTTWRLPATPRSSDRDSSLQVLQQQESPQQETPYKDPHKRRPRVTRFPNGNYTKLKSIWQVGRSTPPLRNPRRNFRTEEQGGRSTKMKLSNNG